MNANTVLPIDISSVVEFALNEDIGTGDVTTAQVSSSRLATAEVVCRDDAVICGGPWFNEVFHKIDEGIAVRWQVAEGQFVTGGTAICLLRGSADRLLMGERTALNFLQTLSGTATITRKYVDLVSGTETRILDTRKTLPGLRSAQKYAVRVGGGTNHRQGLYDGAILKENHQFVAASLRELVARVRSNVPDDFLIEVEIEDVAQIESAIASGASRIMLDNFTTDQLADAVKVNDRRVELEASGNFDLGNVRAAAETGVDYISIGALTKNVHAVDLSMNFIDKF